MTNLFVLGMVSWLFSHAQELLVTAGTITVLVLAKRLVTRWRRNRDLSPWLSLSISAVLALITAGGLLGLVAVWGFNTNLENAYAGIELGAQVANIVLSFVILGGAYALSDFVGHVIKDLARDQDTLSVHEREILHRVSQVTIYTFALLVVIGLFTDNIGSLLVGAGFLGIVVGMAARQTLGAVLAGFVIMFSKPFEVGDWIVVDDNEGTVTDITIVNTRVQSFDGEYVMIPNDVVGSTPVINRTRRGRLRVEVDVGIDYEADPDRASEVAVTAVSDIDRLLDVPAPQAVTKEFGDSSIVLGIRGWIDAPSSRKRWQARTAMIATIKRAFTENGIKIPYPQRELMGRSEAGGFRLANGSQPAGSSVGSDSESAPQVSRSERSERTDGGDQ